MSGSRTGTMIALATCLATIAGVYLVVANDRDWWPLAPSDAISEDEATKFIVGYLKQVSRATKDFDAARASIVPGSLAAFETREKWETFWSQFVDVKRTQIVRRDGDENTFKTVLNYRFLEDERSQLEVTSFVLHRDQGKILLSEHRGVWCDEPPRPRCIDLLTAS